MRSAPFLALAAAMAIGTPAQAAELAWPNDVEEGFLLWSSSAEYSALWNAVPPRNPWLMADAVAASYDIGTRALRSGDVERAYGMWLPLAQAGICRAKFAVGYLLDPASPAALRSVTSGGLEVPPEDRAAAAFAWYLSAAEEGWPAAQRHVGDAYAAGKLVPTDLEAAKLWYRRAARAMDPDAMLALAEMFLRADNATEHREGLTWAFIARHSPRLFWLDDSRPDALIEAYKAILPEAEVAAAWNTVESWTEFEWLVRTDDDADSLRGRQVLKRMFVDLAPVTASPAAIFDAASLALLEGRYQNAFDGWWKLARQGHCRAQLEFGLLISSVAPRASRPFEYTIAKILAEFEAEPTALPHAAMQGLPYAQREARDLSFSPEYQPLEYQDVPFRWAERAAAQGEVYMIRDMVNIRYVDSEYDRSAEGCYAAALLYQRVGIHDRDFAVDHCRPLLSRERAAEIEEQIMRWQPEVP